MRIGKYIAINLEYILYSGGLEAGLLSGEALTFLNIFVYNI